MTQIWQHTSMQAHTSTQMTYADLVCTLFASSIVTMEKLSTQKELEVKANSSDWQ